VVLALIAERLWQLCWRAPLSPQLASAVLAAVAARADSVLQALVVTRPHSHAARLIAEAAAAEGDVDELISELRADATQRLGALRALATLSSTLGLLIGIVSLSVGFDPEEAGLLALEAGRPEKLAMGRALAAMAGGVGCSAVCFYALGRLRPLAARLLRDDARLARALVAG
jgi:ABC-type transporter Mla subunit MlaD